MSPADKKYPLAGLAAGLLGGAFATLVLDLFQQASLRGTQKFETLIGSSHELSGQQQAQLRGYAYAHAESANRLAHMATGQDLTREQKSQATPYMHYAFGTLAGGVYGVAAEYWPEIRYGFGTTYGSLLFFGAAETALPLLELSPAPKAIPLTMHLGGWAGHAVYGAALEAVRRLARNLL